MAQIDFYSIQNNENSNGNSVGFFSLKSDGDEAIVRFAHDSVESFEILTTHDITLNGKFRKVNCIRDPEEPIENCPMCASGKNVKQRIYIRMVQYVVDQNTGNIVAMPKVWDRPASYARKLKSLMDEYGTLTDFVFKIKRHGASGSRETSYDILFCNPTNYDVNRYVKDFSAFDNYHALGSVVLNKNFDELFTFETTGSFPAKEEQRTVANNIPATLQTQQQPQYMQAGGNVITTNPPKYNTYQNTVAQAPPVAQEVQYANGGVPTQAVPTQAVPNQTIPNQYQVPQQGVAAVQRPVRQYNQ